MISDLDEDPDFISDRSSKDTLVAAGLEKKRDPIEIN